MKQTASVVSVADPAQHSQMKRTAWEVLLRHYKKNRKLNLHQLFANDAARGQRMSAQGAGVYLDYSKNLITKQTIRLLLQLAKESGLASRIDAMFRGEKIDITEGRPAMHVAVRAPRGAPLFIAGEDITPGVQAVLNRMTYFSNCVRSGEWKGYTGKRIRNVINVGTGGCALGPAMVFEALKQYSDRALMFRFISDVDRADVEEALRDIQADETLFIVCSRDFKSRETMMNACGARTWLTSAPGMGEGAVPRHFVAVSNSGTEAAQFGIDTANMFPFYNWIGDAYSTGSAVNLSTMIAIGPDEFHSLLDGMHEMDMHFLATPFERNLPVLMALLTIWYVNFFEFGAVAVLPYDRHLSRLPAYLQQLIMQSNGKHVTLLGTEVTRSTSPVYFGEPGTTGQHLFAQFLHQGRSVVPCDIIIFGNPSNPIDPHHDTLVANAISQAEVLAFGSNVEHIKAEPVPDWLVPHRALEGNRPSNVIFAEQLTPQTLGKIIALYEHSVFTQGVIWNINSFDKWAEDACESAAQRALLEIEKQSDGSDHHDSSTNELIRRYRVLRNAALMRHVDS